MTFARHAVPFANNFSDFQLIVDRKQSFKKVTAELVTEYYSAIDYTVVNKNSKSRCVTWVAGESSCHSIYCTAELFDIVPLLKHTLFLAYGQTLYM